MFVRKKNKYSSACCISVLLKCIAILKSAFLQIVCSRSSPVSISLSNDKKNVSTDTVSVLENDYALSSASVSDGLLSHSLETKPVQQPVEVQTKIVYRDSVVFKDVVVYETVEVEKELTGWQTFKMKMGGWMLGLIIIAIVCLILYIVKPLKLKLS